MADKNIKGITVEIGGDSQKLDEALRDSAKKSRDTEKELKNVDKALKNAPNSVNLWKQKQEVLNEALAESKNRLSILEQAQAQITEKFQRGEIDAGEYRKFQRNLETTRAEISSLEGQITSTNEKVRELEVQAEKAYQVFNKFSEVGGKLTAIGGKLEGMGQTLAPISAGIAGIGTIAVKTTANFDEAMDKVGATSRATEEEMEQLRAKAREMGAETKFSASEAADGFNYMAMAGWKTQEMISGIDGILDLAAASGEELGTTSDIVTDALTAFNMTAEQSGHFADILASASSNANTNVSMMGETFKYAAPVMGAMGYSAEDAAIAVGLMANSGIKATQAGTSLRGILTNMAAPSDKVQKAMHDLGVSLDDGEGNMLSFRDVMIQLRSGFGGLKMSADEYAKQEEHLNQLHEEGVITDKQYSSRMDDLINKAFGAEGAIKAQAASMLAGKNALSGLLAIVNASDADFDKLTNAVDNCDGAAHEMAEIMQGNLNGQLTVLKSQLEELAISGGEILMPSITEIVGGIQSVVDWLNRLDPETKKTIVKTGVLAASLSPVLIILGKLTSGLGSICSAAPKAVSAFSTVAKGITALTGLSGGLTLAIGGVVAGLGAYLIHAHNVKQAKLDKIFEDATKTSRELAESVEADAQKLSDLKTAAEEQASADLALINATENLWEKLKLITDENGNVKEGYEEEAEFITGKLADALGIEIDLIDGQIQGYKELQEEIDKTIEKKRAETIRNSYGEVYEQALKTKQNAPAEMGEAMSIKEEATQYLEELQNNIRAEMTSAGMLEDYKSFGEFTLKNLDNWSVALRDDEEQLVRAAFENIKTADETMQTIKTAYDEANYTIQIIEGADKEFWAGNYEAATNGYKQLADLDAAALANQQKSKEERLGIVENTVAEAIRTYKGGMGVGEESTKVVFNRTIQSILEKAKEGGLSAGDLLSTGIVDELSKIDGFDASQLISYLGEVGDAGGANLEANLEPHLNNIGTSVRNVADGIRNALSNVQAKINLDGNYAIMQAKKELGYMASGGTLNYGSAVVAEAGPELLQITRQGVQVTPLTSSAKNTALSEISGGDTYNQTVNVTVNQISGSYDVRKLGRDLAEELRKNTRGSGR